jgi:hypothetical protein
VGGCGGRYSGYGNYHVDLGGAMKTIPISERLFVLKNGTYIETRDEVPGERRYRWNNVKRQFEAINEADR